MSKINQNGREDVSPQINTAAAKVFELGGGNLFVRVGLLIGKLKVLSSDTNLSLGESRLRDDFFTTPESIISICVRSRLVH